MVIRPLIHLLALALLLLLGCSGGTTVVPPPDPDPPRILGVTPIGPVGTPGQQVTYTAIIEGEATEWAWTFGSETRTEAAPVVTLGAVGSYAGTVVARNADGESEAFGFAWEVKTNQRPPRIVAVLVPERGVEGEWRTFAAITSGIPTAWTWTFHSGVKGGSTRHEAEPRVKLALPGSYSGEVVATNAAGVSEPVAFEFTVAPAPGSPQLGSRMDPDHLGQSGTTTTLSFPHEGLVVDWVWELGGATLEPPANEANPVVTLGQPGAYEITVSASNSHGTSTRSQRVVVENPGTNGPTWTTWEAFPIGDWYIRPLVDDEGRVSIAYKQGLVVGSSHAIRFAQALTSEPSGRADWRDHLVSTPTDPYGSFDFARINGLFVLSYKLSSSTPTQVAISSNGSPASAADWTTSGIGSNSSIGLRFILEHNGRIRCVTYEDEWISATSERPSSSSDWETSKFLSESSGYNLVGAGILHGRPCLVIRSGRLLWSSIPEPAAPSDWVDTEFGAEGFTHAQIAGGQITALGTAYVPSCDRGPLLEYWRSTSSSPLDRDDWEAIEICSPACGTHSGRALQLEGRPFVYTGYTYTGDLGNFYWATVPDPQGPGDWQLQNLQLAGADGHGVWTIDETHFVVGVRNLGDGTYSLALSKTN